MLERTSELARKYEAAGRADVLVRLDFDDGDGEKVVEGFPVHILKHMLTEDHVRERLNIDTTKGPHGSTPLHIASRCGYMEIVELLITAGASVDVPDELGETALFRSVEGGHLSIRKSLRSS